ncbi:hypothetical protein F2Q69_00006292 [Brassica cretica]|uniref:Uncharacterized protein n=1 Tax=Brassica cretica TaxID=69181 RepID=A0A8S9P1W0_BRACR|nr:hypothetical protein F2Q69_00006292 [Brassica cretica]
MLDRELNIIRAILTHELKEKGEAAVKVLLSRVLKLNMSDLEVGLEQALMLNPTDHCDQVKPSDLNQAFGGRQPTGQKAEKSEILQKFWIAETKHPALRKERPLQAMEHP